MALNIDSGRADWIKSTYITGDTEDISAKLDQRAIDAQVDYAKQSTRFDGVALDPVTARKIQILKLGLTLATPADPKEAEELTRITSQLEGAYGKGKWCPNGPQSCKDIEDLTKLMAQSRDPKELLAAWTGWHEISKPMRGEFARYVTLANKGAQELGFKDNGAMWRAKYDMPPDDFAKELDRLWDQMKPLYLSLHAYVRARLHQKYGDVVPANGPIPGVPAGQHVGAGLEQYLSAGCAAQWRPRLQSGCAAGEEECRLEADGAVRRGLFQLAGLHRPAADFLGALALPETARPRRGMPRQRLGYRFRRRRPPQDVHPDHGRRFPDHPS